METDTKEDDHEEIRDASKGFESIIEVSSTFILLFCIILCIVLFINHTSFYSHHFFLQVLCDACLSR